MSLDSTGKEKVVNQLYSIDLAIAITSIHFDMLPPSIPYISSNSNASVGSLSIPIPTVAKSMFLPSTLTLPSTSPSSSYSTSVRIFVMAVTSEPTRLYHYLGGPTFTHLFAHYVRTGTSSFAELPGSLPKVELDCFVRSNELTAQHFALMSQYGVYHGNLQYHSGQSRWVIWPLCYHQSIQYLR